MHIVVLCVLGMSFDCNIKLQVHLAMYVMLQSSCLKCICMSLKSVQNYSLYDMILA